MTPQQRLTMPDPSVDQAYSEWHRAPSLSRFVQDAERVKMIDIDAVEVRGESNRIAAIIETTREPIESKSKKCKVSRRLARAAGVPFYLVRIELSNQVNERSKIGAFDIRQFEVCHVASGKRQMMQPEQYAAFLAALEAPVFA
jgi:hypothetical protein